MTHLTSTTPKTAVHQAVQTHYTQAITRAGETAACCSPAGTAAGDNACCGDDLYTVSTDSLPVEITSLSLGCGDPIAIASLEPGQTVLDLGSGAGMDAFLAAEQVGPTGRVIGVDMTPAMLEKAVSRAPAGRPAGGFRHGHSGALQRRRKG